MHDDIFKKFWLDVIEEAGDIGCGCPRPHHLSTFLGSEQIWMPNCVDSMLGDFMHRAVALFDSRHNPRTPATWRQQLVTAGARLLGTEVGLDEVTLRPAWNRTLVAVVRPAVSNHPEDQAVFAALESEAAEPPSDSRWARHENELEYWERRHGPLGRLNFAIHQGDSVVFLDQRSGYTFTTAVEHIASSRDAHPMRTTMLWALAIATDTFEREVSKLR